MKPDLAMAPRCCLSRNNLWQNKHVPLAHMRIALVLGECAEGTGSKCSEGPLWRLADGFLMCYWLIEHTQLPRKAAKNWQHHQTACSYIKGFNVVWILPLMQWMPLINYGMKDSAMSFQETRNQWKVQVLAGNVPASLIQKKLEEVLPLAAPAGFTPSSDSLSDSCRFHSSSDCSCCWLPWARGVTQNVWKLLNETVRYSICTEGHLVTDLGVCNVLFAAY